MGIFIGLKNYIIIGLLTYLFLDCRRDNIGKYVHTVPRRFTMKRELSILLKTNIPLALDEAMRAEAARRGISITAIVREALQKLLDSKQQHAKKEKN